MEFGVLCILRCIVIVLLFVCFFFRYEFLEGRVMVYLNLFLSVVFEVGIVFIGVLWKKKKAREGRRERE